MKKIKTLGALQSQLRMWSPSVFILYIVVFLVICAAPGFIVLLPSYIFFRSKCSRFLNNSLCLAVLVSIFDTPLYMDKGPENVRVWRL